MKIDKYFHLWADKNTVYFDEVEPLASRPKGKWIVSKEDSNYNCSICGCNPRKNFRASSLEWIREINGCDMQYCPWCGADMRGDE